MRLKVIQKGLSIFIVSGVLITTTSSGEVYKWLDDQGVVNYSKNPPNKNQDRVLIDTTKPTENRHAYKQENENSKDAQGPKIQPVYSADHQEKLEKLKKSCEKSHENLKLFKGDMPVSIEIEGKFVTLNSEQRQFEIDKLENLINERCNGL